MPTNPVGGDCAYTFTDLYAFCGPQKLAGVLTEDLEPLWEGFNQQCQAQLNAVTCICLTALHW